MGWKLGGIRYTLMTVIGPEYVKSGKIGFTLGMKGTGRGLPEAGKSVTTPKKSIGPARWA